MTVLPPLPDHRAAALRALGELDAIEVNCSGVTIEQIGEQASLDAGEAWLACYQLQHLGLVSRTGTALSPHLWSLTPEGVAMLAAAVPVADAFAVVRDRITDDDRFQGACQQYAHGNGSSAAIAAAALAALDAAK